jgi:hypothetical protein
MTAPSEDYGHVAGHPIPTTGGARWCPVGGSLLPGWDELAVSRPVLAATMRRYLQQVACSLRPRSVGGVDLALRCFVTFLLEAAPMSCP